MIRRGMGADDFDCSERFLLRQRERAAKNFQRARVREQVHRVLLERKNMTAPQIEPKIAAIGFATRMNSVKESFLLNPNKNPASKRMSDALTAPPKIQASNLTTEIDLFLEVFTFAPQSFH